MHIALHVCFPSSHVLDDVHRTCLFITPMTPPPPPLLLPLPLAGSHIEPVLFDDMAIRKVDVT